MNRYICIHGHFYQPPRENPWLEAIEVQDSAWPYHDWNERITAECYAPNGASRIFDAEGRIAEIVNNYAAISFNFGPTLLAWMEAATPRVYAAVLAADEASHERFGGHGSALAQAHNHPILPLLNARDKRTQVAWGVADFRHRFGRDPEGMWLPEAAVDLESLDLLAEHGIRFTVLAPRQAHRIRELNGGDEWQDVSGERIDPTRPYLQRLPSGREIVLFFYDGPISRGVAFEGLLERGEYLAERLAGAFSDERDWPQLVHIATDGETYGHHHRHGEMALSYALHHIESEGLAELVNYGLYLERHPPEWQVEIFEDSSWSCVHGVERWRADCGCNTGGRPGWNQAWREPLRAALDWLRDELAPRWEAAAGRLLTDPWAARDGYVRVLLDRSPESVDAFLASHADHDLNAGERVTVLELMELQRHAMLMYTSCGWFFDELSGIETVQVIQYAGRVLQLAGRLFPDELESGFLERLERAKSNLPQQGDGRRIYESSVRPAMVDLEKVGAHYALSTPFEEYEPRQRVFAFDIDLVDGEVAEAGRARLAVGHAHVASAITGEAAHLTYATLAFGDHNLSGGVRPFGGEGAYRALVDELRESFERADFPETLRRLDRHLGSAYSLRNLFRDEQRVILDRVLEGTLVGVEEAYRRVDLDNAALMRFLAEVGVPPPRALRTASSFVLNADLRRMLGESPPDLEGAAERIEHGRRLGLEIDLEGSEFVLRSQLEQVMRRAVEGQHADGIDEVLDALHRSRQLPLKLNTWELENLAYRLVHEVCPVWAEAGSAGDAAAGRWTERCRELAEVLRLRTE